MHCENILSPIAHIAGKLKVVTSYAEVCQNLQVMVNINMALALQGTIYRISENL